MDKINNVLVGIGFLFSYELLFNFYFAKRKIAKLKKKIQEEHDELGKVLNAAKDTLENLDGIGKLAKSMYMKQLEKEMRDGFNNHNSNTGPGTGGKGAPGRDVPCESGTGKSETQAPGKSVGQDVSMAAPAGETGQSH